VVGSGYQVKRITRLTSSSEIQRVRRNGRSNAHPLLALAVLQNNLPGASRMTVVAGKSIGGAVQRNRAKRRLRGALQELVEQVSPGYDLVFVVRKMLLDAPFLDIVDAVKTVMMKAEVYEQEDV
jgi:ribonuclease P protein component